MPEVYRLEHSDGAGVYMQRYILGYEEVLADHNCHPHWPAPAEDDMGREAWADMIFGFSSLEQMRNWFCGTERLYLSIYGVLLSKYFARGPIVSGRKQVAFYRACADLIWQKPLNHF